MVKNLREPNCLDYPVKKNQAEDGRGEKYETGK